MQNQYIAFIEKLLRNYYPDAITCFWAGSYTCNQYTKTSDFDIVVIFKTLSSAYREAFIYEEKPIDAFIHSPQTLKYFFDEIDAPSYVPALPYMIYSGIEIPKETSFGKSLKSLAAQLLQNGPLIPKKQLLYRRFLITDLLDDLKGASNEYEFLTICACLHEELCEFFLLANKQWIGKSKNLVRLVNKFDSKIAEQAFLNYKQAIRDIDYRPMETLTKTIIDPFGGELWAGFRLDAPQEWKKDC
ncbi:MAG: N-acetyltransferase [Burkholderiales bacterium]|nr:N-acetyltransferase [Burkholderiales bacterium]